MSERTDREPVNSEELDKAHVDLKLRIEHAFKKHGNGRYLNPFEILGVLQLEFDEFKAEIQNRGTPDRQRDELLDVACVAIVAAASIGRQCLGCAKEARSKSGKKCVMHTKAEEPERCTSCGVEGGHHKRCYKN